MQLNETQRLAVNITNQNTLVFASAGGGKTTVLINRLMKRIIEDRISLDEILAMTFTEAASNEMKKRLEVAILKAIETHPNDQFLQDQKTLIQDAHISTIHSFCLDLMKEYYYVIGLKKERQEKILSDGEIKILQRKAFEEVAYQNDDLLKLNEGLTSSLFSFNDIEKIVLEIIQTASNHYDPDQWFIEKRNTPIHSFNDLKENTRYYYLADIKGRIQLAIEIIEKIIEHGTLKDTFILKKEELLEALNEEEYNQFEHKCKLCLTKLPNVTKDEIFKALREQLKKVFEDIASKLIPEVKLVKYHNDSLWIEEAIFSLALKVYKRYEALKVAQNAIDFNDFEHFAYQILNADNQKIASILKERYKEIMIDEFQDTNDTQYKIASLIENNNLFLVGDIKQSIYRFRGAKPSIMQRLKKDDNFFKIHIKNNYRSKENIIQFNNDLFLKIMNIFDADYEEADVQIAGLDRQKEDLIPVQMFFIQSAKNQKELKSKQIANEILRLHSGGIAFKDIAILVRNHSDKKELKEALEHYHIPYFIKENAGYYNCFAVTILLNYLKLLINPNDHFLRCAILSSPLYNLDDETLVHLRSSHFAYQALDDDLKRLASFSLNNQILECIYQIIQINDFYFKALNLQERSNVDLLINDLSKMHFTSIIELINYIEETKDYQKESASTISEEADVVKVMTIHNSKGLEFKHVFLYSTMQNLHKEKSEAITIDDELGIGIRYTVDKYKNTVDTIGRYAILAKDNREDLSEFIRLLYVALTRAIQGLYIVDAGKEIQTFPLNESLLYARKGFTSLIYNAMKDDMTISFIETVEDLKPLEMKVDIQKEIPKKTYLIKEREEIAPSSLENQDELNFDALKGMEYGTRVHEIFEHLDFKEAYDEKRLKDDFDADAKTIQAILNYLNNPIIQRAKSGEIIPEFSFYLKKEDTLYHGFMDFVAILDDEIILIDYKTDHLDDKAVFIHRYSPQIDAYTNILEEMFHKKVSAYLYSTHLMTFIKMKGS